MFEIEIEGLDKLALNLDNLDELIEEAMMEGVGQTVGSIEDDAKALCPVVSGGLRESIHSDTAKTEDGVQGYAGTNYEIAPYVELGTGPRGAESSPEGKYPGPIQYRDNGWWIHESQVDKAVAERYHWFKIDTEDGIFYFTTGQAAQPFLYPAYAANKDKASPAIAATLEKLLKERMGK